MSYSTAEAAQAAIRMDETRSKGRLANRMVLPVRIAPRGAIRCSTVEPVSEPVDELERADYSGLGGDDAKRNAPSLPQRRLLIREGRARRRSCSLAMTAVLRATTSLARGLAAQRHWSRERTGPPQRSCSYTIGGPSGAAQRSPHSVSAMITALKSSPFSVRWYSGCPFELGEMVMSPSWTNRSSRAVRMLGAM